jgi:hypothetical protein
LRTPSGRVVLHRRGLVVANDLAREAERDACLGGFIRRREISPQPPGSPKRIEAGGEVAARDTNPAVGGAAPISAPNT